MLTVAESGLAEGRPGGLRRGAELAALQRDDVDAAGVGLVGGQLQQGGKESKVGAMI